VTCHRIVAVSFWVLSSIAGVGQTTPNVNPPLQVTPNFNPPGTTEQLETGFSSSYGLPLAPYQIRLLPVSSFPQVPPPVAQKLDRLGCMIPQTYEAHEPENVIHGSFEKQGSHDWAALCSVKGTTTLYVFFGSNPDNPIPLRHQADSLWLGKDWGSDFGSGWGIGTRPERLMPDRAQTNHDGIEDSHVEHSSRIHYFSHGQWTTIDNSP
jgi:hypothetical protein